MELLLAAEGKRPAYTRPGKKRNNFWALHRDIAPAHTPLLELQLLASVKATVTPHPPYSPDLAPCDFLSYPENEIEA
jgi:hypothetical protein